MKNLPLEIFVWDIRRESDNIKKHDVDFKTAEMAFFDPNKLIYLGKENKTEKRFLCIGKVNGKIISVRFVIRGNRIRIFGASKYRKDRRRYEENKR
ncbi:MAG: BrnT family toxin [Bacteriovoracales bacterium]